MYKRVFSVHQGAIRFAFLPRTNKGRRMVAPLCLLLPSFFYFSKFHKSVINLSRARQAGQQSPTGWGSQTQPGGEEKKEGVKRKREARKALVAVASFEK